MLVFIDESGDAGFKVAKGSSRVFVIALVAFTESVEAEHATAAIDSIALQLKIPNEFKFSKTRGEVKDLFFKMISNFDFCVRAIVVDKARIYSRHLRSNKESFYSYFVKSILKFDNGLMKNARVIIDGSGDREFKQELAAYLRKHTADGAIKKIIFNNSKSDRLLQLADMCAGAIARSYRDNRDDSMRWRKMLHARIEDVWEYG